MTLGGLLSAPPAIVAAGVDVFSDALRAQGASVTDVDWRPPGFGDPADLAAIASSRRVGSIIGCARPTVRASSPKSITTWPGADRSVPRSSSGSSGVLERMSPSTGAARSIASSASVPPE